MDRSKIRILLGCEESDAVRSRFEAAGFDAWSCDLQYSSNIFNKKHLKCSIYDVLDDGWHAMICFPPCTHLAVSGSRHFAEKKADGRQAEAIKFFLDMANAPIHRIAIENPVGIMSGIYKLPTQVIQPYFFGDTAQKSTCLWLKNLPPLFHNSQPDLFNPEPSHIDVAKTMYKRKSGVKSSKWFDKNSNLPQKERQKARSKTFNGIADAMVEQWSPIIENV